MFFEEQQNEWAAGRGKKYRNVLERFTRNDWQQWRHSESYLHLSYTRIWIWSTLKSTIWTHAYHWKTRLRMVTVRWENSERLLRCLFTWRNATIDRYIWWLKIVMLHEWTSMWKGMRRLIVESNWRKFNNWRTSRIRNIWIPHLMILEGKLLFVNVLEWYLPVAGFYS